MDYVCSLFYGWLANSGVALFFRNSYWPITGLQKQRKKTLVLTVNVRSLEKNLKPRPCRVDLAIARSIQQGLGLILL